MEGVGVYVTTIDDKNVHSFKESHDIFSFVFDPYPLYIFSFTFIMNKQWYFQNFALLQSNVTTSYIVTL